MYKSKKKEEEGRTDGEGRELEHFTTLRKCEPSTGGSHFEKEKKEKEEKWPLIHQISRLQPLANLPSNNLLPSQRVCPLECQGLLYSVIKNESSSNVRNQLAATEEEEEEKK